MNSTPDTPPTPTPDPVPDPARDNAPKRFERSSRDRMIGGVCGGLARYFGVDVTLVRIGMVALAALGGTGLIVYAAALVLVPSDGEVEPGPHDTRDRALAVGAAIVLAIIGFAAGGFGLGGLFPLALIAVAGLAVWWFVNGERPSGDAGTIVRRAAQGAGILLGCFGLAVGSFFASGFGGGVVVASLVIAAGAALVAAAFVGGARWLVLPAIAIALPLAFVSATGVDLNGGFGERHVRPGTLSEVKDSYRLGAGEMIIDLRDVEIPAGDHRVKVGIGGVSIFERDGGGIDVDWSDLRRAPQDTPRLVIDGDVGLGLLEVRHDEDGHDVPRRRFESFDANELNDSCATRVASRGSGASHG